MAIMGAGRVVVVGAGFTGLLAARRLAAAGHDVIVLEALSRRGGQIRTVDFAGLRIDVGAEAFHTGAPKVAGFIDELGVTDEMVSATRAGTWIPTRRGLVRLPTGVGPAGPTQVMPVLRSRMMTPAGLVRAGMEPLRATARPRLREGTDISVGRFVTSRFGRQVTDLFVDPLLGGLHAGDVNTLSLRACTPMLVPAAREGRSLLVKHRPAGPPGGAPKGPASAMTFITHARGLDTVLDRLSDGVPSWETRLDTEVRRISRDETGAVVVDTGGDGEAITADAVVLAVPAGRAADLLATTVPAAVAPLRLASFASVATTALAFRREDVRGVEALSGTGILVPSKQRRLMKAATFLSTKWPHLAEGDRYVMRLSAGRAGQSRLTGLSDDDLVAGMLADLRELTGLRADPTDVLVTRWNDTMPQLTVGHLERLEKARAAIATAGVPVALAGTGYDGVGLSTCLTSATGAATTVEGLMAVRPS